MTALKSGVLEVLGCRAVIHAPLAQLAEQLTLNQWVPGSSPGGCTKQVVLLRVMVDISMSPDP